MFTFEELIEYLENKKNIYLYGHGIIANKLTYLLTKEGIVVEGYIVSSYEEEDRKSNVFCINSIPAEKKNVVFAIKNRNYEMFTTLAEAGFESILFPTLKLLENVNEKYIYSMIDELNDQNNKYIIDYKYEYAENEMTIIADKVTKERVFRLFQFDNNFNELNIENYAKKIENDFGKIKIISHHDSKFKFKTNRNIEIYVATSHLDSAKAEKLQTVYHKPIQVGKYFTESKKCECTDAVGINISDRNRDYCECTGIYWVWKNTEDQDYVGFEQYRRKLFIDDSSIEAMYREDVDVILGLPQLLMKTTKEFFVHEGHHIFELDWKLVRKFVEEYEAGYGELFDSLENSKIYFSCNLSIMKRKVFDEYCIFAFSVSEKIYSYYKEKNIIREDRYMGYIFEILLSLFVMKNYKNMNIQYTDVLWGN